MLEQKAKYTLQLEKAYTSKFATSLNYTTKKSAPKFFNFPQTRNDPLSSQQRHQPSFKNYHVPLNKKPQKANDGESLIFPQHYQITS
jgi:predicted phosphoadenosine phosphosulfate sulfurtransferase